MSEMGGPPVSLGPLEQWAWRNGDARTRKRLEWAADRREGKARATRAERERYPLYLRFGDLPGGGLSSTWREQLREQAQRYGVLHLIPEDAFERGVSVFRARKTAGGSYEILLKTAQQGSTLWILRREGRPVFLVTGREVGTGGDGEPLLAEAKAERLPGGTRVVGSGRWETWAGMMVRYNTHLANVVEKARISAEAAGERSGD